MKTNKGIAKNINSGLCVTKLLSPINMVCMDVTIGLKIAITAHENPNKPPHIRVYTNMLLTF